ncbi:hypothetical protein [Streptomyces sp. SID3343]|uniref:hypothetical protein n=1 Tax=Streptomyces sp. SID3343 TaxID=2690260 RepID=UPI00136CC3E6|nr:hypothetical protein [Streptomyces sp. SID3343]MYV97068.1 hypothetical protein [Streptomyces sp. SID3343]
MRRRLRPGTPGAVRGEGRGEESAFETAHGLVLEMLAGSRPRAAVANPGSTSTETTSRAAETMGEQPDVPPTAGADLQHAPSAHRRMEGRPEGTPCAPQMPTVTTATTVTAVLPAAARGQGSFPQCGGGIGWLVKAGRRVSMVA